jgi:hypothetical protein
MRSFLDGIVEESIDLWHQDNNYVHHGSREGKNDKLGMSGILMFQA